MKAAAQKYTGEALETLATIMRSEEAPEAARVAASNALLDRAHGKPAQAVTGAGGGGPIALGISWLPSA